MSGPAIKYDVMIEDALRGVMRGVLRQVAAHGLPGNHHFYITLKTRHPGVELPAGLVKRYPDEMTIVLQHQFWDLDVRDHLFEVSLSFNDRREKLMIPYAAVVGFTDPSVKFNLQFEADDSVSTVSEGEVDQTPAGEVVSLDHFRGKR